MSQHMNSEEINRSKLSLGYEEVPHYAEDAGYAYGQKLSMERSLNVGHRRALTISSLVLWIVFFLIVVLGEGVANVTDSQGARLLQPLLVFGFVLFTGFLVAINLLFRRKRQG